MTKKDIVVKFLKARGYQLIKGDEKDLVSLESLLPWLLMDLENSLYHDFVEPMKLKNQLKKFRIDWKNAYNQFNWKLFQNFTEEEQAEICNYMDDLEHYMKNDLVRLRCAVMEHIDSDKFDVKMNISAIYACLVLTIIAETVHNKLFRLGRPKSRYAILTAEPRPEPTPELKMIQSRIYCFGSNYAHQNGIGAICMTEKIMQLSEAIGRKAVKWLSTEEAAITT